MNKTVRVLLADERDIFRVGLRVLLEPLGATITGEARDGYEVLELAAHAPPNIVLMDLGLPRLNGCEVTLRLADTLPTTRVIGFMEQPILRLSQQFLKIGGRGILLRNCTAKELTNAVQCVARGEMYLAPAMADTVIRDYVHQSTIGRESSFMQLTDREREVLQLVAEGTSVKEIAERLAISVKTAHTHRQNISGKLGVKGVAEMTRYALREGITEL